MMFIFTSLHLDSKRKQVCGRRNTVYFAMGGPLNLDSGLLQLEEKSLVHKKRLYKK